MKVWIKVFALVLFVGANAVDEDRKTRSFGIFSITKFPNDACKGGSKNGTCYSEEDCNIRGGTKDGTCAEGYGVCCIFTLSCGQTTKDNCTYITQAASSSITSPCQYTICRNSPSICRIRFDFTNFQIASPVEGATTPNNVVDATPTFYTRGGSIGDCLTDKFSVSAPENRGTPIICGFNSGQHLYVEASDKCNVATFTLGGGSTTRQWDIKVTQYDCGHEKAGPEGCLQYYTSNTGTIQNFNWKPTGSVVPDTSTHLSSQNYDICFRRNTGKCSLCFTVTIDSGTNLPGSFGLSRTLEAVITGAGKNAMQNMAAPKAGVGQLCQEDFLSFESVAGVGNSKFCGRFFNAMNGATANGEVCTETVPFKVIFKTDDNERQDKVTGNNLITNANESAGMPSGHVGFQLSFTQKNCV